MFSLDQIQTSNLKLVSFDVGHTFLFPDYGVLAKAMSTYFKKAITIAQVMGADLQIRRGVFKQYKEKYSDECPVPRFAKYWGGLAMLCLNANESELGEALHSYCTFLHDLHESSTLFTLLGNDALRAFELLRDSGYKLIVISNANGRIERDLINLGVASWFDSVIDSGTIGCAKPDRRIFQYALDAAGIAPHQALHVGDNPIADVRGALNAGMHAVFFDACGVFDSFEMSIPAPRCRNLMDLALFLRRD